LRQQDDAARDKVLTAISKALVEARELAASIANGRTDSRDGDG
jgi:hypothetical protein